MRLTKRFEFCAAHHLPNHHGKCFELHGHTWKLDVTVEGFELKDGMLIDFSKLKHLVNKEIIDVFDHSCLNKIVGLKNPTAENIALWIWDKLYTKTPPRVILRLIKVWEAEGSCVEYEGRPVSTFNPKQTKLGDEKNE